MDRDALRSKIANILEALLDRDSILLTDATTAADIDGWDSLVHLKLLMALEEDLEIEFEVGDIKAPSDVGGLIDIVTQRL